MPAFLDTNILLYSLDTTPAAAAKRTVAIDLLASRDRVLSVQVLQEFYVQATHARRADAISHVNAVALINAWRRFFVVENTVALLDRALSLRAAAGLSLWDSLIVAAAASAGCDVLYTEDLNPGQTIAGVKVVNPFAQ